MDQQVQPVEQIAGNADREALIRDRPRQGVQVWRWLKRHVVFVLTVLVPTLTATVYYGLIASDVYISESRFLVRSPQQRIQSGVFGEILQGTGIGTSHDDTYSVRDFILSRDAAKELDERLGIRKRYASGRVDRLNRFPGLTWNDSFESFYKYYGKHVGVDYDPVSSISILTVRAFTAEDAQKINQALLNISEHLVNSLNDRSRHDLMHFAEDEVKLAGDKAREASLALLEFRSKQAVFEPDKQATIQLEGVAKLQEELVTTEAEIAQLKKLSPTNPQIVGLETRAQTLRTAIAAEAAKVTSGTGSLSAHASGFERLALDSAFADKQLGSALAALETARAEAARQQLYLDRLVQPNLPDKALEPKRIRSILTVFILGFILCGVVSLVLASMLEHKE